MMRDDPEYVVEGRIPIHISALIRNGIDRSAVAVNMNFFDDVAKIDEVAVNHPRVDSGAGANVSRTSKRFRTMRIPDCTNESEIVFIQPISVLAFAE